jgi:hypothetical protein
VKLKKNGKKPLFLFYVCPVVLRVISNIEFSFLCEIMAKCAQPEIQLNNCVPMGVFNVKRIRTKQRERETSRHKFIDFSYEFK